MKETMYTLLQCRLGHESEVISRISAMPQVTEVHGTYGAFDIFCRIRAETEEAERVITAIRRIENVVTSTTLRPILSQGGR